MPDLMYALKLKPEDAIKYFQDKGYRISWDWQDTWQETHSKAFTVAKVTQMDVLQDIRNMVQKSLDEGLTFEQFKKELTPTLKSKGWWGQEIIKNQDGSESVIQKGSPYRLKTIYRTNIQTAYSAGRYKQQSENTDDRPYWQYVSVLDSRTRPAHAALDEKIFRFDDPFWNNFYPPNGWGCRCRVRAFDSDYIKENNFEVETSENKISEGWELVSKNTARPVSVFETTDLSGKKIKVSPDVGWNYNPGKAAFQPDLEKYDYGIAKQYTQGIVTGPPFEQFYKKADKKAQWALNEVTQEGIKKGKLQENAVKYLYQNLLKEDKDLFEYIGVLDSEKKELLKAQKQAVKFSLENFAKNIIKHPEISIEEYYLIPKIIENTETLLLFEDENKEKIFCYCKKGKYYKAVVKSTSDKKENFLQSFHSISLEGIKKDKNKKGVKVLYDNLQ